MPVNDDATRRSARERSQARMNRDGGSSSRISTDSYGRARQDSPDLSQSRYAGQAPRQASQSARDREYEGATHESRSRASQRRVYSGASSTRSRSSSARSEKARSTSSRSSGSGRSRSGRSGSTRSSQQRSRKSQASRAGRQASPRNGQRQATAQASGIAGAIAQLPPNVRYVGIAVILIVVLVLLFAVIVPSCSGKGDTKQEAAQVEVATKTSLVQMVNEAKAKAKTAVETANQVGSLETSNSNVEALVALLGEEEAAKLLAQAKTNPDALWIAAHPDEYAFDGIEVQYKILKLAADEPASIPYVRGFPSKYPMLDAVADKSLAMDVASPSSAVPTTKTPHLYQWDRRWAYTIYSSASFGLTGCGPTSLAMVYQGLNKTVDRTPHDMAVLAEERGYMSEFNGTDSAFFIDVAPDLGLNCWEEYPDAANIVDELSQGNLIIANLGPGYFTTNGHFFVLAGLTDDGQVIVNDPYSVARSSQTWDAEFIAGETMAMFVYSKA